jgi:hypothetical protein
MEKQRKALMIKECLRQEINGLCLQLSSQVNILAKMNGLFTKDLSLLPKDKTECLDSNLSDTWMAKYVGGCLEVMYQRIFKQSEPPALMNIKIQTELSCIRFDCANRMWMCNQDGYLEILDVRRSVKLLCPVRYILSRLQDKVIHSRMRYLR